LIASPVILIQLIQHYMGELEFLPASRLAWPGKVAIYALAVYMVMFHGGQPEAFIYFQF
jgi:hypothetical protein